MMFGSILKSRLKFVRYRVFLRIAGKAAKKSCLLCNLSSLSTCVGHGRFSGVRAKPDLQL